MPPSSSHPTSPPSRERPASAVAHYPTRGFTYYEFNLDPDVTTKWQDQRVRQALLYALDRESIVNDILLGYAEVAQGTQPVVSYAYAPDRDHDQVHLRSGKGQGAARPRPAGPTRTATASSTKTATALSFELLYRSGSPTADQLVAYMQDAWAAIGVDATPRALEFPALIEATTTNPRLRHRALRISSGTPRSSRTPCSAATSTRSASTT